MNATWWHSFKIADMDEGMWIEGFDGANQHVVACIRRAGFDVTSKYLEFRQSQNNGDLS